MILHYSLTILNINANALSLIFFVNANTLIEFMYSCNISKGCVSLFQILREYNKNSPDSQEFLISNSDVAMFLIFSYYYKIHLMST